MAFKKNQNGYWFLTELSKDQNNVMMNEAKLHKMFVLLIMLSVFGYGLNYMMEKDRAQESRYNSDIEQTEFVANDSDKNSGI